MIRQLSEDRAKKSTALRQLQFDKSRLEQEVCHAYKDGCDDLKETIDDNLKLIGIIVKLEEVY